MILTLQYRHSTSSPSLEIQDGRNVSQAKLGQVNAQVISYPDLTAGLEMWKSDRGRTGYEINVLVAQALQFALT